MEITIGCDPEIFVRNTQTGELVSAYDMVPGTKKNPHFVEDGMVQVDGMALEFGIKPASTVDEFKSRIHSVMDQLHGMLPPHHGFAIQPTAHFGIDYIKSQPEVARDLGCEPDFNAYTGQHNPKPNVEAPFRTASGHIHIGWTQDMDPYDPEHFEACCMLAKQLDFALAVPSRLYDTDTVRRSLYGDLGAFRPKSYGMEYRVLSNMWLTHGKLIEAVFHSTKGAVNALLSGKRWYEKRDARTSMKGNNYSRYLDYFNVYGSGDYNFMKELWNQRTAEVKPALEEHLKMKVKHVFATGRLIVDDVEEVQPVDPAQAPQPQIDDAMAIAQRWFDMQLDAMAVAGVPAGEVDVAVAGPAPRRRRARA